jgi:hypothetical protein
MYTLGIREIFYNNNNTPLPTEEPRGKLAEEE